MSSPFENAPPTAPTAEAAIIATVTEDSDRWLPRLSAAGVTRESFFVHRRLFGAVTDYCEKFGRFEITAFVQHLQHVGEYDTLGGGALMETLLFHPFGTSGWPVWINQLQEAYALRLVREQAIRASEGYEDSTEAAQALKDTLEAVSAAKCGPRRSADAKQATETFIRQYLQDREAGAFPGRPTGLFPIDGVSGGMRPGDLWVIGGQTSRGKSVLMLQIAAEVIADGGKVAIFSLEMSVKDVTGRLATVVGKLDYNHITRPREVTTKHDIARIQAALAQLGGFDFRVDDTGGQTLEHITAECDIIRDTEGPLDLIVIDYIQLVEGDRRRGESREQEVARISRGLKQLAKAHGCPVVTATQLNDEGKTRESRAIGQDADALLFIAADGVKVGKLRNGRRDDVLPLILDGQRQRFVQATS